MSIFADQVSMPTFGMTQYSGDWRSKARANIAARENAMLQQMAAATDPQTQIDTGMAQLSSFFNPETEERFPFHQSDMRYKHIKTVEKESDSAVVFFVMDVSGSMSKSKKYIARSFFFLLYHFLRHKYNKIAIEFIAHTTEANVTDEDKFFNRVSSGGTYMSSGVEKVIEMCNETYHPNSWNIYTFHCSDGDNWSEDNSVYADAITRLVNMSQLYGLIEIGLKINNDISLYNFETVSDHVKHLVSKKFKIVKIGSKTDIWEGFEKMFGGLK